MPALRTILNFNFLTLTLALAHTKKSTTENIKWCPCNETEVPSAIPMQCGTLLVPLDYTSSNSTAKLKLELARIPATVQPSKGSILTNFGGPGEPGRGGLGSLGPNLVGLSGGEYDLIAFDTRGTQTTIPFSWIDNDLDAAAYFHEATFGNASDVALGRLWATATLTSRASLKANETGGLIGTAFVARDLISVVNALEEDGMLRYWGFSYGTTLGATVAAMFPDRIDKMVLDGVQNPHEYYHAHADFEEWTDSDKVFSGIFTGCVEAGPSKCALARRNETAAQLEQSVWDLIYAVKAHPIPIGSSLLDYTALKGYITNAFYGPSSWASLASILDLALTGDNLDSLVTNMGESAAAPPLAQISILMSTYGIHCSDRTVRAGSFDEILPAINKLTNTSRFVGDVTAGVTMTCAQWKMDAKERYLGDFQVQTKKPVLFIGNTYDAHTPIKSAHNVSAGFEGSVVLEVDGYGHSSLAQPSLCTLKTVSAYWANGTLPEPGRVCNVDAPLYSNVTWADIFQQSTGNKTSLARRDAYEVPNMGRLGRKGFM